jgi:hypothetical protein
VILSPLDSGNSFPLRENLERVRRMGDWFPLLLGEYMHMVFVEEEFEKNCRLVECLSPKDPLSRLQLFVRRKLQKWSPGN